VADWVVRADGRVDVKLGSIALAGCYPAIDGVAVRAMWVRVAGDVVRFGLEGGEVEVRVRGYGEEVRVGMHVEMARLPFRVGLVGRVVGARRAFVQGLGFSGPSGLRELSSPDKPYLLESYLVTGLVGEGRAVGIFTTDHRDYLQQTSIRNRTSRRGLVNRHLESEDVEIEIGFLTERVNGGSVALPEVVLREGVLLEDVLSGAGEEIGRGMDVRLEKPARWHVCTWYRRHSYLTLGDVREMIAGLRGSGLGVQAIQIDDGHQSMTGDWLVSDERKFPGGVRVAFEEIAAAGFVPGVWIGPYMVGSRSRLFAEHPDWVVRRHDGSPWTEWKHYDGTNFHEEHYCLDATHPGVREYIGNVFRQMRAWGAGFFKTDFMDWGLKDSWQAVRHDPSMTSVQAYREVGRVIREAIGPESYWLACIAPYGPLLGLADGVRVANDLGTSWGEGSQGNMLAESRWTQWMNRRLFETDPDVFYLRRKFNELTWDEMVGLGYWQSILGMSVNTSDTPAELDEEGMRLWRFLRPEAFPRPALVLGEDGGVLVAVRDYEAGWGVLMLNASRETRWDVRRLAELVGRESARVWEWGYAGSRDVGAVEEVSAKLGGHGSRLWFVGKGSAGPTTGLTVGGYEWDLHVA
jgi:alpha-galactosidase